VYGKTQPHIFPYIKTNKQKIPNVMGRFYVSRNEQKKSVQCVSSTNCDNLCDCDCKEMRKNFFCSHHAQCARDAETRSGPLRMSSEGIGTKRVAATRKRKSKGTSGGGTGSAEKKTERKLPTTKNTGVNNGCKGRDRKTLSTTGLSEQAPEKKIEKTAQLSLPIPIPAHKDIDYSCMKTARKRLFVAPIGGTFRQSHLEELVLACRAHSHLPRGVEALDRVEGLLSWPSGHKVYSTIVVSENQHQLRLYGIQPSWNGVASKLILPDTIEYTRSNMNHGHFGTPRGPGVIGDRACMIGPMTLCDHNHGTPVAISSRGWCAIGEVFHELGHYVEGVSDCKRAKECGALGVGNLPPSAYAGAKRVKARGTIMGRSTGDGDYKYVQCRSSECWCYDCAMDNTFEQEIEHIEDRVPKHEAATLFAHKNKERYEDYATGLRVSQTWQRLVSTLKTPSGRCMRRALYWRYVMNRLRVEMEIERVLSGNIISPLLILIGAYISDHPLLIHATRRRLLVAVSISLPSFSSLIPPSINKLYSPRLVGNVVSIGVATFWVT
jgi:hypothetical protein